MTRLFIGSPNWAASTGDFDSEGEVWDDTTQGAWPGWHSPAASSHACQFAWPSLFPVRGVLKGQLCRSGHHLGLFWSAAPLLSHHCSCLLRLATLELDVLCFISCIPLKALIKVSLSGRQASVSKPLQKQVETTDLFSQVTQESLLSLVPTVSYWIQSKLVLSAEIDRFCFIWYSHKLWWQSLIKKLPIV